MNSQASSDTPRAGRWLKRIFGVLALLVLAYALVGTTLLPFLGKRYLQEFVQQNLQRELRVQSISFNPFTFSASMEGVELREADGALLLSFQSLAVEPEPGELLERRIGIRTIRLQAPWVHLRMNAAGESNLVTLAEDIAAIPAGDGGNEPDTREPEAPAALPVALERFSLSNGAVRLSDERGGSAAVADLLSIRLELNGVSSEPDSRARFDLSAALASGGRLQSSGELGLQPLMAEGKFSLQQLRLWPLWDFTKESLDLEPPGGAVSLAAGYSFSRSEDAPALQIDAIEMEVNNLRLARPGVDKALLELERAALVDGRFDLDGNRAKLGKIEIAGGSLSAVRRQGRLDWQDLVKQHGPSTAEPRPAPGDGGQSVVEEPAPDWRVDVDRLNLARVGIDYTDSDLVRPLHLRVGAADLSLRAQAAQQQGELSAGADDISLGFDAFSVVRSGDTGNLLTLDKVRLSEAAMDLSSQNVGVGKLLLSGGQTRVVRLPDGGLEWAQVFEPAPTASEAKAQERYVSQAAGAGWGVTLDAIALSDFSVAVRDAGVEPAAKLDITGMNLELNDVDSRLNKPFGMDLSLAVEQGGRLALKGEVDAAQPTAELEVDLQSLSLLPARPYLQPLARARLTSGALSSQGKLVVGKPTGDALSYRGRVRIDRLSINEQTSDEILLGWQAMESTGVTLSLQPDGLQITEVKLEQPNGKFAINKDASTNWQDILVQSDAEATSERSPEPDTGGQFPVSVEKISITGGKLDFADSNLPLPFATKIHALDGAIVGVSTEPGAKASSDLKGRVDEFGTASISGEIAPFDPLLFTDMDVVFENLDVTRLTPYSAKFAGYKVDSGKLSLDLKYRIEGRKLEGENQILLNKLKLGEKVESPDAIDAPLELAIALMEDSRGVIDLGLPIRGDLDDPEFSYGHLVFKAIGNLLTKIVTAPFKVLGALLGVEGDDLDTIVFAPGSAELAPPEEEKLQAVAKALAERPALILKVGGGFHTELDAQALRETALKLEINRGLGRKPQQGQRPDPVSLTDAKTHKVLEKLYTAKFSAADLAKLKKPPKKAAGDATKRSAGTRPANPDLYKKLYEKLVDVQPLTDTALTDLGRLRGERIVAQLTEKGGLQASRVRQEPVVELVPTPGEEGKISVKLDLTAG